MAVAQRMSEEQYQQFVLAQPDGQWELHDGRLVEKPGVTWEHADIAMELAICFGTRSPRRVPGFHRESRPAAGGHDLHAGRHGRAHCLRRAISRSAGTLAIFSIHCRSSSRSGHRRRASTTSTPSCPLSTAR